MQGVYHCTTASVCVYTVMYMGTREYYENSLIKFKCIAILIEPLSYTMSLHPYLEFIWSIGTGSFSLGSWVG